MNHSENRLLPVIVRATQSSGQRDRPGLSGERPSRPANPYATQLLGQDGQKRGLRGGASVLEAARSAYLGAEYSGGNDRRPSSGLILRKAI